MFNARIALILAGLAFATWETIDIFWISFPAAAAVFAALFLGGTLWLWRRDSVRAALALLLLFAFEAAVAPTLKAMTVTKVADLTLALTGVALAMTVVVTRRRTRASRPVSARRHVAHTSRALTAGACQVIESSSVGLRVRRTWRFEGSCARAICMLAAMARSVLRFHDPPPLPEDGVLAWGLVYSWIALVSSRI